MAMKIASILEKAGKSGRKISLELLPDRSYDKVILQQIQPLFCSVAWLNGSREFPIKFAEELRSIGQHVLVHLPGRNFDQDQALEILNTLQEAQICNILVVQGDLGELTKNCFPYASDFVKFVREMFKDYFCIGVAANPEKFSSDDLKYLKLKVDAGADFLITQPILDVKLFEKFSKHLQQESIDIPVVPGLYPFKTHHGLIKTAEMCEITIPEDLKTKVENIEDDPEAIRNVGVEITTELTNNLFTLVTDVHMFCLNDLQIVKDICVQLEN